MRRLLRPSVAGWSDWLSPPFADAENNRAYAGRDHDMHAAADFQIKLMIQSGTKGVMSDALRKKSRASSIQNHLFSVTHDAVFLCISFPSLPGDTFMMQHGISFFLLNAGNQEANSMQSTSCAVTTSFPSIAASFPGASQACICSGVSETHSLGSCRSPG